MCTIEEKDVLLEYIADTAGMVLTGGSGKYSPAEPAMLAQIRDRFYDRRFRKILPCGACHAGTDP